MNETETLTPAVAAIAVANRKRQRIRSFGGLHRKEVPPDWSTSRCRPTSWRGSDPAWGAPTVASCCITTAALSGRSKPLPRKSLAREVRCPSARVILKYKIASAGTVEIRRKCGKRRALRGRAGQGHLFFFCTTRRPASPTLPSLSGLDLRRARPSSYRAAHPRFRASPGRWRRAQTDARVRDFCG